MAQYITHHSSPIPVYTDYRGGQDHYHNASQGAVIEQKCENAL